MNGHVHSKDPLTLPALHSCFLGFQRVRLQGQKDLIQAAENLQTITVNRVSHLMERIETCEDIPVRSTPLSQVWAVPSSFPRHLLW